MRILLVEDEEVDFKLIHSILSKEGHEVIGAHSAVEAMEILKAARPMPHLILMDLLLPWMNGVTFVHLLKNTSNLSSIPVVAITAHVDHFFKDASMQAGFADFLVKPVSRRLLLRQIAAVAGKVQ